MTLTTTSGYQVYLKDYLTFGEKRQLEKLIASRIKVQADSSQKVEIAPVEGSLNYEMQDLAFSFLVQKINKDGQELTSNLYEEVMSWREADGQAVFNAINELTSAPLGRQAKKN